jgi:hypothetical protein
LSNAHSIWSNKNEESVSDDENTKQILVKRREISMGTAPPLTIRRRIRVECSGNNSDNFINRILEEINGFQAPGSSGSVASSKLNILSKGSKKVSKNEKFINDFPDFADTLINLSEKMSNSSSNDSVKSTLVIFKTFQKI